MLRIFLFLGVSLVMNSSAGIFISTHDVIDIDSPSYDDIDVLVDLIDQLGFKTTPEIIQKKLEHFLSSSTDKIWVARVNHEVVGMIAINILTSFYSPLLFARIDTVVVKQEYRKLGIGKALIQMAENYAKQIGCSRIFLTSGNHRCESHKFYQHVQYQSNATYFVKYL